MTWLVTGGAGYIGAHVARALEAAGMGIGRLGRHGRWYDSRDREDVQPTRDTSLGPLVLRAHA